MAGPDYPLAGDPQGTALRARPAPLGKKAGQSSAVRLMQGSDRRCSVNRTRSASIFGPLRDGHAGPGKYLGSEPRSIRAEWGSPGPAPLPWGEWCS